MKLKYFAILALTILVSAACNTDGDKEPGTMDSIGNPTPNPTHRYFTKYYRYHTY